MRVIVCGSRSFDNDELMERTISKLVLEFPGGHTIVHGAAMGADGAAQELVADARLRGSRRLAQEPHPADWNTHGKKAGILRNIEMAKAGADLCLAFWDGNSPGTAHMIATAVRHGIPVRIVPFKPEPKPKPVERIGA